MPELPPVIATLIADTREFSAKMDESAAKLTAFGKAGDTAGQKFTNFANKASTAIIGAGVAIAAYGIDRALKYEKSLSDIQNQANVSAKELDYLKTNILKVSSATATSSDLIAQSYLQAEKAGLHYAAATSVVTDAAKAAQITGGDVVATTQTLIGVENLQIAKGMSIGKITDTLVKANKDHVGSLDSLVSMLGGKVGAAMAEYNVSLGTGLAITDELAKSGFTNTRAIATMFQAMGKLESPTTASSKALAQMGLNADTLASKIRQPNGLLATLEYLKAQAESTGTPIQTYLTKVFGTSGGTVADVLVKNLSQVTALQKTFSTASSAGLNTTFGMTKGQLSYKLEDLKNQIQNIFTGIGLTMLPAASDLATFSERASSYFSSHPLISKIATDSALGLFAASLAFKLFGVLKPVFAGLGTVLASDITVAFATGLASFATGTAALNSLFGRNHAGIGDIMDYLEGKIHPTGKVGPRTKGYLPFVPNGSVAPSGATSALAQPPFWATKTVTHKVKIKVTK